MKEYKITIHRISQYIGDNDLSFIWEEDIKEAVGKFNIGFEEMVKFYNQANSQEIRKMEKIIKANDWKKFKELIKKVLGIILM
jgi:hypothetical protein